MKKAVHKGSGPEHRDETLPSRGFLRLFGSLISAALLTAALGACTPSAEKALDTNVPLRTDRGVEGPATTGVMVWRSPDLATYERAGSAYYIPDATVYQGRGSAFADLTPDQVNQIAAQLTTDVRKAISSQYKVEKAPGPGSFTLNLVLIKVMPPGPTYIANGPYPWSQAVIGMPDAQTMSAGQMTVAGKFIDSASGKLLVGFVAPVSPQSMNLGTQADINQTLSFAERASSQFAADLVSAITRQRKLANAAPAH